MAEYFVYGTPRQAPYVLPPRGACITLLTMLEPISAGRRSLADEAYERITAAMLSGTIAPGARLVMDALAEELEISRTPVRDALRRLEQEGLIEPAGRRGFVVREIDAEEIRQTYEAREAVEGYAARLAARRGPVAAAEVRQAIARAEEFPIETPLGSYQANRAVHRAVVAASGNRILLDLFDDLWGRGLAHQIYAGCFRGDDSHAALRRKHQPIVRAIKEADGDAAEAAMTAHLRDGLSLHHLEVDLDPAVKPAP
jgi:DNA-binding GntR family transcriptional regulator